MLTWEKLIIGAIILVILLLAGFAIFIYYIRSVANERLFSQHRLGLWDYHDSDPVNPTDEHGTVPVRSRGHPERWRSRQGVLDRIIKRINPLA